MAKVGLRYPVFAPLASETAGSALTYGTPVALDDAIAANISFTRSSNPLYGNDTIVENDNGITGGTVSFNTSDLSDAQQVSLLGHVVSGSDYEETDASAPYGGFGYIRVKKKTTSGTTATKFVAYWLHKVQFALNSDEAKTKAAGVEWQTPTLEGNMFGVYIDATGNAYYRRRREFSTYADAKAWIDNIAGIPVSTVATPAADPVAGAVAAETDVALTCATSGATIYYTTDGSTPTTGSMVYSAAITVYAAMTIKAIAAKAGMNNSAVLSAAYTITT